MKIVIDAGHGGKDPGAVGNGLKEKDVVLQLALEVGAILKSRGAQVIYTRSTDTFIELSYRTRLANESKAIFFLSLHINAGGGSGFESFIYSGVNGGPTAAYQNVIHRKVVKIFADKGLPDRGQKKANFAVLRETAMPSLLLEYGFIDSQRDSGLLKDPDFLTRVAKATANGVSEIFGLPIVEQEKVSPTVDGFCKARCEGIEVEGVIINNTAYVPVRAVSELLGASVKWDSQNKIADINK